MADASTAGTEGRRGAGRPLADRTHAAGSGAPAAPAQPSVFGNRHTPTPTPAPPRVIQPSPALPGYTGRRRRTALVAGVVVLLLLAGAGLAFALTRDSDDDRGGGGAAGVESSAGVTPPAGEPTAAQRQAIIDDMAEGIESVSPLLGPEIADCTAETWLETAGLQAFVDAGLIDENWTFVDRPMSELTQELRDAASTAANTCASQVLDQLGG